MTHRILVLNGPNLNMLGTREPELYGSDTLADAEALCRSAAGDAAEVEFRQSNHEGQLVDWIQEARDTADAIVINPGGYSHTSVAILDALMMFDGPVMEVHVSNIFNREPFRHHSFVSKAADGVLAGYGIEGYAAALRRALSLLNG